MAEEERQASSPRRRCSILKLFLCLLQFLFCVSTPTLLLSLAALYLVLPLFGDSPNAGFLGFVFADASRLPASGVFSSFPGLYYAQRQEASHPRPSHGSHAASLSPVSSSLSSVEPSDGCKRLSTAFSIRRLPPSSDARSSSLSHSSRPLSSSPVAFAGPRRADPLSVEQKGSGDVDTPEAALQLPSLPPHYTIVGFRVQGSQVLPSRLVRQLEKELLSKHVSPASTSSASSTSSSNAPRASRRSASPSPGSPAASSRSSALSAEENEALIRTFVGIVNAWYLENGYLFAHLVPRPHFLPSSVPVSARGAPGVSAGTETTEKPVPAFLILFDCEEPPTANPPLHLAFFARQRPPKTAPDSPRTQLDTAEKAAQSTSVEHDAHRCEELVETQGTLNPELLAHHLGLVPGKPFKWDAQRWHRVATEADLFADAHATAAVLPGDGGIRVEVAAVEKPACSLRPGLSFSSALRDVEGQLLLEHRNLFGTAARGSVALRLSPSLEFLPGQKQTTDDAVSLPPSRAQSSSLCAELLFNSLSRATDRESVRLLASASSSYSPPPLLPSSPSRSNPSLPSSSLLSRILSAPPPTPETPTSVSGVSAPLPATPPQTPARLLVPAGHFRVGFAASGERRLGAAGTMWGEATIERRKGLYVNLGLAGSASRQGSDSSRLPGSLAEASDTSHVDEKRHEDAPHRKESQSWGDKVRNALGMLQPPRFAPTTTTTSVAMVSADDVASLLPSRERGSVLTDPSVAHDVAKVAGGVRFQFSESSRQFGLPPTRLAPTWGFEASSFAGVYTPYTAADAAAAFAPLTSSGSASTRPGSRPSRVSRDRPLPPLPGLAGFSPPRPHVGTARSFSLSSLMPSRVSAFAAKLVPRPLRDESRFSQRCREVKETVSAALASVSPFVASRAWAAGVWTRTVALANLPFAPVLFASSFPSASPSLYSSCPPLPYCGASLSFASRVFPFSSLFLSRSSYASSTSQGRLRSLLLRPLISLVSPFDFSQLAVRTRLNIDLLLPPRLLLPILASCLSPASSSPSCSARSSPPLPRQMWQDVACRGRALWAQVSSHVSAYLSSCSSALSSAEAVNASVASSLPSSSSLCVLPRLSLCAFPVIHPSTASPAVSLPSTTDPLSPPREAIETSLLSEPAAALPFSSSSTSPMSSSVASSACSAPAKSSEPAGAAGKAHAAPAVVSSLPSHADRRRFLASSLRAAAARLPPWEMLKLSGQKGNRLRAWGAEPVGIFEAVADGAIELSLPIVAR
ncbi:putative transmembrane protein [Toxoplasma gondii GAB2-2007-GAL-DOM2]|uniref:Transmembrane protein n=8 Tax=Toxoplasma gondii TaxID=5811 RepID=S7WC71_TOXGG|nr:hypothetical protein TGGT1_272390 [Toxoplasma gondii GT1]KAF4642121.1 hypothetical protein TGRH88_079340 [Toxoplasma gondii]KFG43220.1 putative transmembrane protein [Toxoplasma gondii GAB2-2007-GAL-DOM2]PUA92303.1 putative transmembrane protein [Toxoplasma gondii TgCATBr9]